MPLCFHCSWLHAERRRAKLGRSSGGRGDQRAIRRVILTCIVFTFCSSPAVQCLVSLAHAKDALTESVAPLLSHAGCPWCAIAGFSDGSLGDHLCQIRLVICLHVQLGSENSHGRRRTDLCHVFELSGFRWHRGRRLVSSPHFRPPAFGKSQVESYLLRGHFTSQVIVLPYSGLRAVSYVSSAHTAQGGRLGHTATPMPLAPQLMHAGASTSFSTHRTNMELRLQPCRHPMVGMMGSVCLEACRNCNLVARIYRA